MRKIKKIAGYLWAAVFFSVLIYMVFWKGISHSDIYQRNFNIAEWNLQQQKNAERQEQRAARRVRFDELDRMECAIILRAKAAIIPIEIERNTLYGMSQDAADKFVLDEFELDKKLCEEHGIPPSNRFDWRGGQD